MQCVDCPIGCLQKSTLYLFHSFFAGLGEKSVTKANGCNLKIQRVKPPRRGIYYSRVHAFNELQMHLKAANILLLFKQELEGAF